MINGWCPPFGRRVRSRDDAFDLEDHRWYYFSWGQPAEERMFWTEVFMGLNELFYNEVGR